MEFLESMTTEECRSAISQMVERGTDQHSILRLLRVSRLKLGAAIERIESGTFNATTLDAILRHTECAAFEIDTLMSAFQPDALE
jgi:hypothetical protein